MLKRAGLSAMVMLASCTGDPPPAPQSAQASSRTTEGTCTSYWQEFSSAPYRETALPDTAVRYFRYPFPLKVEESVPPSHGATMFKVTGRFPHARYMNFNVYDQETMDTEGSLADRTLIPDAKDGNRFAPGSPRDAEGSYTVWFVPKGQVEQARRAIVLAGEDGRNVSELPAAPPRHVDETGAPLDADHTQLVELWYRVYLPEADAEVRGAALPTIEARELLPGVPRTACPVPNVPGSAIGTAFRSLPPKNPNGDVDFYRSGGSLYPNGDNAYLSAQLDLGKGREVAVVRWKPPSFPDTGRDPKASLDADVRYYSLCLGGVSTKTSACLSDAELVKDADGFVEVVIGPEDLEARVKAKGLNFLPRGTLFMPLLVYRNLLANPTFAGRLTQLELWPPTDLGGSPPAAFAAHTRLGEFAPRGRHFGIDDFVRRYGIEGPVSLASAPAPRLPGRRRDDGALDVAFTWSLLYGTMAAGVVTRPEDVSSPRSLTGSLKAAEATLGIDLKSAIGLGPVSVRLSALDSAAQDVASGDVDLAIVSGADVGWAKLLYPELDVLVYGSPRALERLEPLTFGGALPTTTTRLYVRAGDPMPKGWADLRGKRLSWSPSHRASDLVALYEGLRAGGYEPEGFFALPTQIDRSVEDELEGILVSNVAEARADVYVANEQTVLRYASLLPGPAKQLVAVDAVPLPQTPSLAILYHPGRLDRVRAEAIRGHFLHPRIEGSSVVARLLGVGIFAAPDDAYRGALASFDPTDGGRRAFSLPIYPFGVAGRTIPLGP